MLVRQSDNTQDAKIGNSSCLVWIPRMLLLAIAFIIWEIFWPGLLSYDSIDHYGQALSFRFNNWHPPFLPLVLSLFFAVGGGISSLLLMQAIFGIVGIYYLFILIYQLDEDSNCSCSLRLECLAFSFILLLCSPLTPTIFYFVTYWKDVWAAFFSIWVIIFYLRLIRSSKKSASSWYLNILMLIFTSICLSLTRKNSIALDPILTAFSIHALFQRFSISKYKAVLIYGTLLILLLSSQHLLVKTLKAVNVNQKNVALELDLLSIAKLDPRALEKMLYTKSNILVGNWAEHLKIGECRSMDVLSQQGFISKGYFTKAVNKDLEDEYLEVIKTMPLLLIKVKLLAFKYLLLEPTRLYYPGIKENPYGLSLNDSYHGTRDKIYASIDSVLADPWANLLSRHVVWFAVVMLLLIQCILSLGKTRTRDLNCKTLILAFSLSAYLIYMISSIASDYRYLFPATLLTQIYFFARFSKWANSYCKEKINRRTGKAS